MILSSEQKIQIENHASSDHPKECCGFVLPKGIYECQNKASSPLKNFSISAVEYLKAKDLGAWAVYHSHPESSTRPSYADSHFQEAYQMSLVVYSNMSKKFNTVSCDGQNIISSLEGKTGDELSQEQKAIIKDFSIKNYPEESCGIGLKGGSVILCENQASDKNSFFSIQQKESDKHKGNIDFIFHSHCRDKTADFSEEDEQISTKTETPYVLYNVLTDEFKQFKPEGILPYEGRVMVPGILDCSCLAQDYYKRELNFNLPTMSHPFRFYRFNKTFVKMCKQHWEKNDPRALLDFYLERGFTEVGNPKLHDLILSNSLSFVSNVFTHISVYLGNDEVLDYGDTGISGIYTMERFLSKNFGEVKFLRHKDFI
jgi:proteasome lid subunit RPN8/RPN11